MSLSSPLSPCPASRGRKANNRTLRLQGLVDLTWHAQLNCQRSAQPDGRQVPSIGVIPTAIPQFTVEPLCRDFTPPGNYSCYPSVEPLSRG
jgi:hypothetical protein